MDKTITEINDKKKKKSIIDVLQAIKTGNLMPIASQVFIYVGIY